MTYDLSSSAAIPPRSQRAARGRLLARLGNADVGAWSMPRRGSTTVDTNLVRVENTGTATIIKGEAIYITGTNLGVSLESCQDGIEDPSRACGGTDDCIHGTCGEWPETYEEIYDAVMGSSMIYRGHTSGYTQGKRPKPSNIRDWLVAAEDIAADAVGTAYVSGRHLALIWDPQGLLGSGAEVQYVDLPWDFDSYTAASDSDPECTLPLQVRPNGRARVVWYDESDKLHDASAGTAGATTPWGDGKVRLALIEKAMHFAYPQIPVTITGSTSTGTNQYEYDWQHLHVTGLTSADVGKAINLAEDGNTATVVNGLSSTELDDCFGSGGWELQPVSDSNDQSVVLTIALDSTGDIQPYFHLQNQIVST